MHSAEIRLVIGTRPEAIKLAPVADALVARGLLPSLILTGQQPLALEEYDLAALACVGLDCPGEKDPHRHVRRVAAALLPLLCEPPDLLIVQGDTSSALGAALAGFTAGVPVAHVEAGLRTWDPSLPWPEEEYRTAIDAQADLLFAPTELAARNLTAELVAGEIHITGNTGVDALLALLPALPAPALHERDPPKLLVTCHRRESWSEGLRSIAAAVGALAGDGVAQIDVVLHPNAHVNSALRGRLGGVAGVSLIEPCGHRELVLRMRDADLILSDSGGIQEEAPALGTPLLVLRDKTERPEGVAAGNARLVGTDADRIVAEVRRLLADPPALEAMSRRTYPYGDGRSGPRIALIIEDWLKRREEQPGTSAQIRTRHSARW